MKGTVIPTLFGTCATLLGATLETDLATRISEIDTYGDDDLTAIAAHFSTYYPD